MTIKNLKEQKFAFPKVSSKVKNTITRNIGVVARLNFAYPGEFSIFLNFPTRSILGDLKILNGLKRQKFGYIIQCTFTCM